LAFGRTDYSGHFFPIAMVLLAKEKGEDFMWFFNSLKNFCFFNFSLDLERFVLYLLMDACDAEYNAVSSCFPLTNLLMCWFHVEYNVGKHILRKRVPEF
jgi:hypothetical protein